MKLYLTIQKISVDEKKKITEDLKNKNFWYEHALTDLDSWIASYYMFGRFPGAEKFTNVPNVNKPIFFLTAMPLSPLDLYKKFRATDAKGLVSLHGLAALNIYFGGNSDISKIALGKHFKNLTYQALSQENGNIFLSFSHGASLTHSLLETFKTKEKNEVENSKILSQKINEKLDIRFEEVESPAMKIQLATEESEIEHEPKPVEFSTPLKIEEINEFYDRQKSEFLKTQMQINQINLESTAEVADSENEMLFDEIINPTPDQIVDDDININTQFDFENSDLDASVRLNDSLKARLDEILQDAREKISSVKYPPEPVEDIPSNPLSQMTTDDIYIDDSLTGILNQEKNKIYFPQPSTDDRKDFEINIPDYEMIVFKLPSLTFTTIAKSELKTLLNKIIEDSDLNLDLVLTKADKADTKQKITLLKNFIKRYDTTNIQNIEKQIKSHESLSQLVEDQLKSKTDLSFGENYEKRKSKNKFPYNTTSQRKRKLLPLTSEERLKELLSIYQTIPADLYNKIESTKEIFSDIIGRIPPESYENLK